MSDLRIYFFIFLKSSEFLSRLLRRLVDILFFGKVERGGKFRILIIVLIP